MANVLSISAMQWIYRMHVLVFILSCIQFGCRDFRVANGFEMPSRYNSPKRIHESTSNTKQQYPKSSPSRCKYDLGLGKNLPMQSNAEIRSVDRETTEDRNRFESKTTGDGTVDENDIGGIPTYDACRFLVEHEATRKYPTPYDRRATGLATEKLKEKNLANALHQKKSSKTEATSAGLASSFAPNTKRTTNEYKNEQSRKKATAIAVNKRFQKPQQHVKVQPKRSLEDCLTILDHDLSDSSKVAAPVVSMNSTIWSRPDTPQLDMNSVWVEMLLHNQMANSQSQS